MVYIGLYVYLKSFGIDYKRHNTIKCKMLCNFNILAGMDVSSAVDCGHTSLPGCIRGHSRQSFLMFSVGLSCFLSSYEIVHLCCVQFVCIPV